MSISYNHPYRTTLSLPETEEEQEVLIWYEYLPAFSRYRLPDDYDEVDIIKATDLYGEPLEEKWNLLAEEWMNSPTNQELVIEHEREERDRENG